MLKGSGLLPASGGKARKVVVLFHGYGSQGSNLLSLARHWAPLLPTTEFLTPNAPEICQSSSAGYQWFDLEELTPLVLRSGLDKAQPVVKAYLLKILQERALTPKDLAVVGFSQGGLLALDMMFALPGLQGLICYSGGICPPARYANTQLPKPHPRILLVHGDKDTAVPFTAFHNAQQQLKRLGVYSETLTCSGLGHSISQEGVDAGGKFLRDVLAEENPGIHL